MSLRHTALYVPAAAAGGTDVTATLETLTFSVFASVVDAVVDNDVTATLATLSLTDFNTGVNAETNVVVTLATLTLTGNNPTLEVLVDTNVTATLETLAFTPLASVVVVDNDVSLDITLETLTLTPYGVVVVGTTPEVNITATLGALTLSALASVVAATDSPPAFLGKGILMYSLENSYYQLNPSGLTIEAWTTVITTQTYTATPFDLIEAQTSTINLPASPYENNAVIVANSHTGNVTIEGNGNNIKVLGIEETSVTISQVGNSLHFVWFSAGGYWRIV